MFDGNTDLLLGLITDAHVDEFVRSAAMGAFGFLVFDGRLDRGLAVDFLQRFDFTRPAPPGDFVWHAWMVNVALLGFGEFSGRVERAFRDGRIPDDFASERDFRALLGDASNPALVAAHFERENLGYIEDVLEALQGFGFEEGGGCR
jgi:hypothetical protein